MAARERSEKPYEDGGGFGKFRKRPFRRTAHTTPYDRPPTAIRNANHDGASSSNGWLAKLVDPAHRLITFGALKLFASVFPKRLPPPSPAQPPEPELNRRAIDKQLEAVPAERLGTQGTVADGCDKPSHGSGRCGVTELELILKQKTFTRSEIDRLTALLQSRSTDLPDGDEEKRSEVLPSQAVIYQNRKEVFPNTPVKNNGTENCFISTPAGNSNVLDEDIASPAELAKAYMGSRPSKVSPSMLGLHGQPLRENSTALISRPFASKSPFMSVVPKSSGHARFPENGFVTPRSQGRSATYSMARTPYSRVHSTAIIQGTGGTIDAFGGQSSSSQSLRENNRFSESKQGALKRRSSVLDNDIGYVGPIRRIRQKSNLLPASGSLSIRGAFGSNAARHRSLTEKATLVGEPSKENGDNGIHVSGCTSVPSKSSEMASKILQQLDVLVSSREKSPAKLSSSMLSGQALRSTENVDSPKFLENVHDNNKLDVKQDTTLPDARDSLTQQQDKAEENGPTKAIATYVKSPSAINDANTTSLEKKIVTGVKTAAFSVTNSIEQSPLQKKRAFQMSAHEDHLALDNDDHPNGTTSTALAEVSEKLDTPLLENKNSAAEAITVEKPPAISGANNPLTSTPNKKSVGADGLVVPGKSSGFTLPAASLPSVTVRQALVDSKSTAVTDKAGLLKESNAVSPMFSFGEKAVSAKQSNGASPTSNLSFKTGDKVPQFMFSSSSSVANDSSGIKFGASTDLKPEKTSFVSVAAGVTEPLTKEHESDKADNKNVLKSGVSFRSPETITSAVSTTSTASIFSFGIPANSSSLNNGSLASPPSSFSSPSPPLFSNNFTGQNSSGSSTNAVASSTSNAFAASAPATDTGATSSPTVSASAPSFTAAPIFKFGSSMVPSTSASSVLATTSLESTETKTKEVSLVNLTSAPFGGTSSITSTGSSFFGGTTSVLTSTESNKFDGTSSALTSTTGSNIFGGTSSAIASNGSNIFGGTSSAATSTGSSLFSFNTGSTASTAINQSQGFNPFSTGSAQTSAAGTAFATSTQSIPIQFGSSTSSPSFGLSGNTALSSGSSLFSLTSTSKLFSSGSTLGTSSTSSSSETTSVSSTSSTTAALFGSNWQAPKSPIFGSTFNSSASSSTGFAFGAPSNSSAATNSTPMVFGSSTGGAPSSGSIFPSSSSAVATPSLSVFGNPNPSFTCGSSPASNNDQMTMEDSMAEDTDQATTPTIPGFGQQTISSAFVFGSTVPSGGNQFGSPAPTGANPFQFGSQSQNPSTFQASGSQEFNAAGGSFSLGTGGVDKSNRKSYRVRKTQRKK